MVTILEIGVWLLGLCVGSFLNVVVYRLPHGLSIARPTWSFCPHCSHPLRSRDNVPLLGWLVLRGRCRDCAAPISAQYPLVEALTGLVFVLVFHWLWIQRTWPVAGESAWPGDLALAIAWFTLAACLIACAAMDIVSYLIDTGVTLFATIVGVVSYAFWPAAATTAIDTSRPALAAALAAGIVCLPMLAWVYLRPPPLGEHIDESPENAATQEPSGPESSTNRAIRAPLGFWTVALVLSAFVVPVAALIALGTLERLDAVDAAADWPLPGKLELAAGIVGVLAVFLLMVISAGQPREADDQLAEEIEDEAPQARRTSIRELLWLAPSLIAAAVAWMAVSQSPTVANAFGQILASSVGGVQPIAGAAFAVHGAIAAAAAGGAVRLVFTLVFGREAFGVGDIYILGAAGACAGWPIALLGFLLSVGVALLAWLASLTTKRSAMIAFGPPLALGFLLALWAYRPLSEFFARIAEEYEPLWRASPVMLTGFFVLATVFAVLVSRMLRRFIEPPEESTP